MALLKIENIAVRGMAACLPSKVEYNKDYPYFDKNELDRIIPTIGVEKRHILEKGQTCGDLAYLAAERMLQELGWEKDSVQLLIYCSPDRDHIVPDTACIIHGRLNLPKSCMAFDMTLGCTGWTYPITAACSIMSGGFIKRALVLTGNFGTYECAYTDKTAYPLFSDVGAATALEYDEKAPSIYCQLGTDGKGWDDIIIRDGGSRNRVTEDSLKIVEYGPNIRRTRLNMEMNGMNVFSFALRTAPQSIGELMNFANLQHDDIDNYFFHQANFYMVKKIIRKMHLDPEKAPFSITKYGNTGANSVPFTMITERADKLRNGYNRNIACTFGVGLSWASLYFETNNLVIPELIYF